MLFYVTYIQPIEIIPTCQVAEYIYVDDSDYYFYWCRDEEWMVPELVVDAVEPVLDL